MQVQKNISLQKFNTFGIDVKAHYFAQVQDIAQIKSILSTYTQIPLLVLGGGSNILFTKDFEGILLKINLKGIKLIEENAQSVLIEAQAGENWDDLVQFCVKNQWAGIENLSLIYGTVGAAPIQNIGAYGVEIQDVFHSLDALEISTQKLHTFYKSDCAFGYRDSVFKKQLKDRFIICSVRLLLQKKATFSFNYKDLELFFAQNPQEINLQTISHAVRQIRTQKLPKPEELGNAGSFFKNPEISAQKFESIRQEYPQMPFYAKNEKFKIPAAWLIEKCEWKGKKIGNTGTYQKQALVLVNYGQATGSEIAALAKAIQESVYQKFGISLETEVNIL